MLFGENLSNYNDQYNKSLHILHERAEKTNDVEFWKTHDQHREFFDHHTNMTDGIFTWTNYNSYKLKTPKQ